MKDESGALFTIGHSDHAIEGLIGLLRDSRVSCLVDVRAQPYSRRHPQFRREALATALERVAIDYRWEGQALGGRRRAMPDSPHRSLSAPFRAYADHMASAEFHNGIEQVLELARQRGTALMCAEGMPESCHRWLIADYLSQRDCTVVHILRDGGTRAHRLSPSARWSGKRLVYDRGAQGELI